MTLRNLLVGIDAVPPSVNLGAEISSVACDSRKATPGSLFVAIRGEKTDGNRYVTDAVARGARVVLSEQIAPAGLPPAVAWIEVRDARKALATAAANFYGRPAETLKLAGVTGTNGKTTTVFLVDAILRAAGLASGMFGTIRYRTPKGAQAAANTTPESLDLQRFLADVRDAGGTHATLEVSSHALALDRVWGCPFGVAVFTNLTRDHLDFHKTMDAYFAAKRRFFEGTGGGAPAVGVVNTDDPHGKQLAGLAQRTLTYGLLNGADITTKKFALAFSGLEFTAQTPAGKIEIRSPLVGRINVYNILAAAGAGIGLGLSTEAIEQGIRSLECVPGRFARIDEGQPFLVVVDYAHTDDALRNLIQTARELVKTGRIITLFGCGGERDRTKRPLMGEAAGSMSDLVVLSNDNPRGEDPLRIINDAVVGLQKVNAKYVVEPELGRAIEIALEEAREGDIVLLAGKGHETYQVLKDRTIDFDDHEVARAALRQRGYAKSS
ncbi:MAG: UDP-N-acetylmuramoyl-L-alanyl-D-glutamate--2,6-diaminopimelate ligase [Acidobacteria bacterium]|nr:UDP-N-acetylmuramoyl-L-alanyl-D-glutamate--2,6-diaminopimelate ligase [Acidobacteriota bacterium]